MSDEAKTAEIVRVEPGGIEAPKSTGEIEAYVKRAIYLSEKLDELRAAAVKRTFPSDWVQFGPNVFLEGDGGLRLAPVVGLELTNVQKEITTTEDGTVVVTMRGDAFSKLFGVRIEALERTRTDRDGFLRGKADRADLADVVSACHKGLIARAAQLVCGLSGLTPEELKSRYGIDPAGKVEFKTSASDAKKADQATAQGDRAEISRLLRKLSDGNDAAAVEILVALTKNDTAKPPWPGKRRVEDLTEKGVAFVLKKLKEREVEADKVAAQFGDAE